jgi:hypothetical protein
LQLKLDAERAKCSNLELQLLFEKEKNEREKNELAQQIEREKNEKEKSELLLKNENVRRELKLEVNKEKSGMLAATRKERARRIASEKDAEERVEKLQREPEVATQPTIQHIVKAFDKAAGNPLYPEVPLLDLYERVISLSDDKLPCEKKPNSLLAGMVMMRLLSPLSMDSLMPLYLDWFSAVVTSMWRVLSTTQR